MYSQIYRYRSKHRKYQRKGSDSVPPLMKLSNNNNVSMNNNNNHIIPQDNINLDARGSLSIKCSRAYQRICSIFLYLTLPIHVQVPQTQKIAVTLLVVKYFLTDLTVVSVKYKTFRSSALNKYLCKYFVYGLFGLECIILFKLAMCSDLLVEFYDSSRVEKLLTFQKIVNFVTFWFYQSDILLYYQFFNWW